MPTERGSFVPTEERAIEYHNRYSELRKDLLESFETETESAMVQQIKDFFDFYGLSTDAEVLLIEEENYDAFKAIFDRHGCDNVPNKRGGYLAEIGICYCVRDKELERINGSAYVEMTLVHELAHATDEYARTSTGADENVLEINLSSRAGQALYDIESGDEVSGGFFEEGFAELLVGEFRKNQILSHGLSWEKSQLDALGLSSNDPEQTVLIRNTGGMQLPAKYIYLLPNGEPTASEGAGEAYGLELLIKKKPELSQALIEARKTVEGLRQVAKIVDEIQPGLYIKLRDLYRNLEDARYGLRAIIRAIS